VDEKGRRARYPHKLFTMVEVSTKLAILLSLLLSFIVLNMGPKSGMKREVASLESVGGAGGRVGYDRGSGQEWSLSGEHVYPFIPTAEEIFTLEEAEAEGQEHGNRILDYDEIVDCISSKFVCRECAEKNAEDRVLSFKEYLQKVETEQEDGKSILAATIQSLHDQYEVNMKKEVKALRHQCLSNLQLTEMRVGIASMLNWNCVSHLVNHEKHSGVFSPAKKVTAIEHAATGKSRKQFSKEAHDINARLVIAMQQCGLGAVA